MKLLILLTLMLTAGCGQEPRKNYFRDISLDSSTLSQLQTLVTNVNQSSNHSVLSLSSGTRPITIRMVDKSQLDSGSASNMDYHCMHKENAGTLAHARYLQYHCLIEVRTDIFDAMDEQLGFLASNSDIEKSIQLVLLHEIGHCFGLGHVNDSSQLMSTTFNPAWINDPDLIPDFSQQLKLLSE